MTEVGLLKLTRFSRVAGRQSAIQVYTILVSPNALATVLSIIVGLVIAGAYRAFVNRRLARTRGYRADVRYDEGSRFT